MLKTGSKLLGLRAEIMVLAGALIACGSDATAPAAGTDTGTEQAPAAATPVSSAAAGSSAAAPSSAPSTQPSAAVTAPASTAPASTPATPASAPASPAAAPATAAAAQPSAMDTLASTHKMAMDECGLHTKYPGDEYCILPPPDGKGFQVHIGPSNYDNPEQEYLLAPGEENVINLSAVSGNDQDILYYFRQYRMRPGSHHVIMSTNGQSIGGTQNLARDQPDFGIIPPENEDVGLPLAAHSPLNANMHFYNFTDKPMVRELWINYWYKDKAEVKETANRVFSPTSVTPAVAHSHVVVGANCAVEGSGRLLSLAGHRHLNNVRFSIWLNSGGKKDLVFDDYDSQHPGELEYNSLATNPMPNPMAKMLGGTTGILNVKQGDSLDFECEIINQTDKNFFGANEAEDDEMCILNGEAVGATISPRCTAITARKVAE